MITKTIEGHFCEHCNKLYQRKHFAIQHEIKCLKNPLNDRPCFNCEHLDLIHSTICVDYPNGSAEREVNAYWCTKNENYLIPPISKHRGHAYEFGDYENIDMPVNCGQWFTDKILLLIEENKIKVSDEEYKNFKQLALADADTGEQLYLGLKERM